MSIDQVERIGAVLGAPREGAAEDFFRAIDEGGTLPSGVDAREAASAVTCVLLARLDLEQGREVLDTLPVEVTAAISECPIHGGAPGEAFGKAVFLERIGHHLQLAPEAVEAVASAVLHALRAQLPPQVSGTIEHQLPGELRSLWRRQP